VWQGQHRHCRRTEGVKVTQHIDALIRITETYLGIVPHAKDKLGRFKGIKGGAPAQFQLLKSRYFKKEPSSVMRPRAREKQT
jgi:hypothetical protein